MADHALWATQQQAQVHNMEGALLGALLERPDLRDEAVGRVEPEHMASDAAARALELLTIGPRDTLLLLERAAVTDREVFALLNEVWGQPGLQPWRVRHYAEAVRQRHVSRTLQLITEAQQRALKGERTTLPNGVTLWGGLPYEQVISLCAEAAQDAQTGTVDDLWTDLGAAAGLAIDQAQHEQDVGSTALPTGIDRLDTVLNGGLRANKLCVLSGRPGSGKTAFALHLVKQWAEGVVGGAPGAFVTLEMTATELAGRLLADCTGIEVGAIARGALSDPEWALLLEARERLSCWPMVVSKVGSLTAADIRAAARPLYQRGQLRWLVVDYLTLLEEPGGARTKTEGVGANCSALKALAREWDIPVVLLAQMNRQIAQGAARYPRSTDLRDSGQIEQDADVIVFVHVPDGSAGRELVVTKNRGGVGQAVIAVDFVPETMTWRDGAGGML